MVKTRKQLIIDCLKELGGEAHNDILFNMINDRQNDRFGMSPHQMGGIIFKSKELEKDGDIVRLIE